MQGIPILRLSVILLALMLVMTMTSTTSARSLGEASNGLRRIVERSVEAHRFKRQNTCEYYNKRGYPKPEYCRGYGAGWFK